MNTFEITSDSFLLNGKKTKIISGSIHYFRILETRWRKRLLMLKECGCNCVDTYVAWNLVEKKEGEFDKESLTGLGRFIDTAKELGLYVIVRPGPYICSEWDFGGFPWWLLKYPGIHLRTSDPLYLEKITPYINEVNKILKPRTFRNGGNVIFVQIENEYGCKGDDKAYLNYLKGLYEKGGLNVNFLTSDNESIFLQSRGHVDGALHTINYRYESDRALPFLKREYPNQPAAAMELWNGHADHFNEIGKPRDLNEVAKSVEDALKYAELVNMYMFSGGTNFGFMNGSLDFGGDLIVQRTSYDTEAPINEYGQRTKKYYVEQKVIHEYLKKPIELSKISDPVLCDLGEAMLVKSCSLDEVMDAESKLYHFGYLPTMEETSDGYGYIIYRFKVFFGHKGGNIILPEIHDIAHLYVDGEYKQTFFRNGKENSYNFPSIGKHSIEIIVENLGRVNFGRTLKDFKGLVGDITLEDFDLHMKPFACNFDVLSVPFAKTPNVINGTPHIDRPSLYEFKINVEKVEDTLLKVEGFTRGIAFINDVNLGRHWDPKFRDNILYVPKEFLKVGENKIVVFDIKENGLGKKASLVKE